MKSLCEWENVIKIMQDRSVVNSAVGIMVQEVESKLKAHELQTLGTIDELQQRNLNLDTLASV